MTYIRQGIISTTHNYVQMLNVLHPHEHVTFIKFFYSLSLQLGKRLVQNDHG